MLGDKNMKKIIEEINKLNGKCKIKISCCFLILFLFLIILPKLNIISEIFSENNVFYFPVKYMASLNRILDRILIEKNSYTITANGFLRVDDPEIARQMRVILINEEYISSKLFPFINIDKERDRAIRDTLEKVTKKFKVNEDANGDGKTNCVDAALWFYYMYPYRKEVMLTINKDINHAFNTVIIRNTLRCIEPQAFTKDTKYFMEDCWGSQYDSEYNVSIRGSLWFPLF